MSAQGAVVFGCEGLRLSADERRFFADANPFGLILFARNVESPQQVAALVAEFRAAVNRADAPVLIDQEGGRVARLSAPHWQKYPSASEIAALYEADPTKGLAAAKLLGRLLANQLALLGITINCAPVCDLKVEGADAIVGDRSFGANARQVAQLARAVCDGHRAGGVLPVIKHIPGHGRALADSHISLPVVDAPIDDLRATDFAPFSDLADMPLAMTAHILYPALDGSNCASCSPFIIDEVIRGQIGFKGLLLSDDLWMEALKGTLPERATAVLAAGCDVALCCKGTVADMAAVAAAAPPLTAAAAQRWAKAQSWVRPMGPFDVTLAEAEFRRLVVA